MTVPHILCVVGARPNFMKIAPIMRAFAARTDLRASLLHTGQHYDAAMKQSFFDQLAIPEPDVDLGVGSGTHSQQTAQIMLRFEEELDRLQPDAVLVVGDVNSTIACALVAVKNHVPVIHVEAGLRSFDRAMPEEINRILTDQISDVLFTTEADAAQNLSREGIEGEKVVFVGNVMIDTLHYNLASAVPAKDTLDAAGQAEVEDYALVTLHRPSNVDDPETLRRLLGVLLEVHDRTPLVFPVHPRTRGRLEALGLMDELRDGGVTLLEPQGYREMLGLMRDAALVLTDSGGIQEETTALGVPCLTLRESTERPITVSEGTNTVVGTMPEDIREAYEQLMGGDGKAGRQPQLWDGKAAVRIAEHLSTWLQQRREAV